MRTAVVMLFTVASAGCSATCLRDSDCIGDSVCHNDRCVLVTRRDAGPSNAPAAGGTGSGGASGAPSGGASRAGSGGSSAGGETTDPRWNLDAAADSAPPSETE